MVLQEKDYLVEQADIDSPNFIAWLEYIESKFANNNAILFRRGKQKEFTVWTYRRFASEARRIACGLLAAGLKKGDCVALWSENCPEWMAVWMGAALAGCAIVPVDFLVSEDECYNIIKFTKAKAFFFSSQKTDFAASQRVTSAGVLVFVNVSNESYSKFGEGAELSSLPGAGDIKPDDCCSIVFTSGTTGLAKGVMLSHKAIIDNANAAIIILQPKPENNDVFINVLPLHHTYPTTCSFISPFCVGVPTIIVERIVGQVVIDDIRDGKGTFLIAVPLLYDKVMHGINSKYQKLPFFVRFPINVLRSISLSKAKKGRPEFGRKALRFFRKKAGLDSINIMVAGGGALSPKTADFFDSFGFNMLQGYGMSENAPLISVNTIRFKNNASVGLPVKHTEVRIVDRDDDSRYLNNGENGEIIVKSPSIMLGYYENPQATSEMFNKDGYLKTGDLGYIDPMGFIFINGRKKNLIVSSGGKNIYPEEIEGCFFASKIIAEILVVGRTTPEKGEHIFAAVFPNYEALTEDYGDKANNVQFVTSLVKKEIEMVNRKLPVYKKISDWTLRKTEFEKNAQRKIRRFLYKDYETVDVLEC
ncbi:MAG: AMP-binding protein [Spirochaetaceae bacterium]|jgi:long-chain acyl-CoA synthetase|nr:AMP-binding protein [Spirochaetaceae bacterium]